MGTQEIIREMANVSDALASLADILIGFGADAALHDEHRGAPPAETKSEAQLSRQQD